jgi:hypothetical protein
MEAMDVPKAEQKKKCTYIGIGKGLEDGCTEGTKKIYGSRILTRHSRTHPYQPYDSPVDHHAHKTRPEIQGLISYYSTFHQVSHHAFGPL